MCFAIPKKILSLHKNSAIIEGGARISLGNLQNVSKDDYVLVYGNVAIDSIKKVKAIQTRALMRKIDES